MKINWNYIKVVVLLGFVILLFSFAKNRNKGRYIQKTSINFTDGDNVYITKAAVNKLLTQKIGKPENLLKDTLDLSMLETQLNHEDMIANAEVYLTVDGVLGIIISQRKPIARIFSEEPFYIDSEGKAMPLSSFHSARVPILVGIDKNHIKEVFPLLKEIGNYPFLSRNVVAIQRLNTGDFELEMRNMGFNVKFGRMENLERKLMNFLAFYKKAKKENLLDTYKSVDLQFTNQVVATKM